MKFLKSVTFSVFILRARTLIAALWVGSLWTVGYLVAPTLFVTLADRVLAGTIAGSIFRVEAWVSVGCAITLIALIKCSPDANEIALRRNRLGLIIAMLTCTLIGYFGLQPFMAALREAIGPSHVMASDIKSQFGLLHGTASTLYLIESLLGVVLILKLN